MGSFAVGDQLKPIGGFESPGLIVCLGSVDVSYSPLLETMQRQQTLVPCGVIFIDVFVQQSLEISRDTIAT